MAAIIINVKFAAGPASAINAAANLFNRYQFLTIRQYLSLVFILLVLLLLVLAVWP